MSGTLDECLGRLYELFMENRVSSQATTFYLAHLRHDNGDLVFGATDIRKMLEKLEEDKEGFEARIEFEEAEMEGEEEAIY